MGTHDPGERDDDDLGAEGSPPATQPLAFVEHALVVEDEPGIRRQVAKMLGRMSVAVSQATSVQSAKALLVPPLDLVIADVRLPDGTGHQVLRAALALSPMPVLIAISGQASASEAFHLARSGAVAFLEKPFGLAELEHALRSACANHFRARNAPALPPAAELGLLELSHRHALTPRQIELVRHVVGGTPRADLPKALGISPATCKALARRVLERCGKKRLSELLPEVFSPPPE